MTASHSCPICNGASFTPSLEVRDHTVSQETFTILRCDNCGFMITSPVPSDLGPYYESPDYISHSDKAATLTDLLYKFARTITLRWKTNLINYYNQNPERSLLDYGCGTGSFLSYAKEKGWSIHGVEPAARPRATATSQTQTTIAGSLAELAAIKVNVITLWHVLEHVHDLHTVLGRLTQLLNTNGTIFIAVPNHRSFDAQHYGRFWAAYDTPRHLWHFSKANMQELLRQHGLKLQHVIPMKLDAFYVSMLSEKYKRSPGESLINMVRGFGTGLRSNLKAMRTREYSSLIYIAGK